MIKKIALVQTASNISSIYSLLITTQLGLPILGGILKNKGYEVDIFHDKIRKPKMKELLNYDLIGFSSLTNSILKAYEYGDILKKHNKIVITGGPHVTFLPEEGLEHCDYVVRGEGEETLAELIEALNNGKSPENIKGLSYKKNGNIIHNEDREHKEEYMEFGPDFSLVKGLENYKKDLFKKYFYLAILHTSRGCPYNCKYCVVIKMAGRKLRYRNLDLCIKDIKHVIEGIPVVKTVMIVDDNFTVDMKRSKEFLRKIIKENFPERFAFAAQVRAESFKDEEFLSLLKEAGFGQLHVGYESINELSLKEWRKKQSLETIKFTIEQAKKYKLKINGMFILGSDYDTEETIEKTVDFAIDSGIATMQLTILTPFPGTDLYEELKKENRIFTFNWNYYDVQHTVFFPKLIKPGTLQRALIKANKKFFTIDRMFFNNPIGIRITHGTGSHIMHGAMEKYAKMLEKIEGEFYSEEGKLLMDKLSKNNPENHLKYL